MCTDRRADGGDYIIPFVFFLKKKSVEIMMTECLSHIDGFMVSEDIVGRFCSPWKPCIPGRDAEFCYISDTRSALFSIIILR